MKKHLFSFLLLALCLTAVTVFAAGKLPYDKSGMKVPVQNLQGLAPVPTDSVCTSTTTTKGTITTITNNNHIGLKWSSTNASGAAVIVKRKLNSNTAYMPESSGTVAFNGDIATVAFAPYSAASATYTICSERQ